ncbi:HEAT repeat domain-containing protein [Thiofilum flexile]|uniref:HEAT repeat domain-containing protein n=1 Tax=Thiofilum flexile TaxID=125627 RepID=UPI00037690E8|nr:HEAT repeat domain-containing protein [Thiofilum flexile]
MSEHQYLNYRGEIRALVTRENQAAFVTSHPEGQATALYRVDCTERLVQLQTDALPCGASALVGNDKTLYLAGLDGKLYQAARDKGKPKAVEGIEFNVQAENEILELTLLASDYLAVLQPRTLSVVSLTGTQVVQVLDLEQTATVMAASPEGQWLSIGFSNGSVAVYQWLDNTLQFSAQAPLHKGAVTALCFEKNELRFYSAGADKQLLSTHAQGELQPLDKGKNSVHSAAINSIVLGTERFFTGSEDKSIKAWAYSGGQPITYKQSLPKIHFMGLVHYLGQSCLLLAGKDQTLRLVSLEQDKPVDTLLTLHDGYDSAEYRLKSTEPKEREQALTTLAAYNDKVALGLIEKHFSQEQDRSLRELMVKLIDQSSHSKANLILEACLNDKRHESVRKLAFNALVARFKTQIDPLYPLLKALDTQHTDIALLALKALGEYANTNPRAEQALTKALDHAQRSVRLTALNRLEGIYPATDPKADLLALQSTQTDVQRAALIRLYQRHLLASFEVQRALLRQQEQENEAVRHTAWLISVLSRPNLALALKTRDRDLARQLTDLEQFDLLKEPDSTAVEDKTQRAKPTDLSTLNTDDYTPLLQGMSSRHADISFNSVYALAVLQDPRALGLLLVLAQHNNVNIRVGVCKALAWLQLPQAREALEVLLNDPDANVRDAAFSALSLLKLSPLTQASLGLSAKYQDSHARGLKVLLDTLTASSAVNDEALSLLKNALNDPFEPIRQETFKACLVRHLGGGTVGTLRLLLSSQYENIHREVLKELMAQPKAEWASTLLLDLLHDPFAAIALEALTYGLAEKKRFDSEGLLLQASQSPHVSVRKAALEQSLKKPLAQQAALLQRLINDPDESLRQAALQAIIEGADSQALSQALQSPYEDIQVNAACVGARVGDESAYPLLVAFAQRPHPAQSDKHLIAAWQQRTVNALGGLGDLGDSRAFAVVQPLLEHTNVAIAKAAARVLPWVSAAHHTETLIGYLTHNQIAVRAYAALALGLLGDEQAIAALKDGKVQQVLSAHEQLMAWVALKQINPVTLQALITGGDASYLSQFILISAELWLHPNQPYLTSWALVTPYPPLQLLCADFIERYGDRAAQWDYIQTGLQQAQRHQDDTWIIELATLEQISAWLVYAPNLLKARLIQVLSAWDNRTTFKQWQWQLQAFNQRYQAQLQAITIPIVPEAVSAATKQVCEQQTFGAYLGLLRSESYGALSYGSDLNIRRQAVMGLSRLAQHSESWRENVIQSLLPALNHPQQLVRQQVFETLQHLAVSAEVLGRAALSASQPDMAEQGLKLLVAHTRFAQVQPLLEQLVQSSDAMLATEAWKVLSAQVGLIKAAPLALQSYYLELRVLVVQQLAEVLPKEAKALDLLIQATKNDYRPSAVKAAAILLQQQQSAAVPALKQLLTYSQELSEQRQLVALLKTVVDQEVPEFLFEYLNNPLLRLEVARVYEGLAYTRPERMAKPLLQRLNTHKAESTALIDAVLRISGYDQVIEDYEDERGDQRWLAEQYPRHDPILVALFQTLVMQQETKRLSTLWQGLRWAKTNAELDQALLTALPIVSSEVLPELVTTIGRRFYKRQGVVTGLRQALKHKDPDIQFLGAEGLALGGRSEGLSTLLAAIDYQPNANYRQRAVLALGEMGNERALDKLLSLAQEQGHFLQEVAIEALGHLGQSDKAETIFRLLKSALENADYYSDMVSRALNGLRWFNTLAAWQIIADYSQKAEYYRTRQQALQLLQYWDTPASRTYLLTSLRKDTDNDCVQAAYDSARRLWKVAEQEFSEIDVALIQGYEPLLDERKPLERVARSANSAQIMQLLTEPLAVRDEDEEAYTQVFEVLVNRLMNDPLPQQESILQLLQAERLDLVSLIARRLAREKVLDKAILTTLEQTLTRDCQQWQTYQRLQDSGSTQIPDLADKLWLVEEAVSDLIWVAVVQNVAHEVVITLLNSRQAAALDLQMQVLKALLVADKVEQEVLKAVHALTQSELVELYELAQQVLKTHPLTPSTLQKLTSRISGLWHVTASTTVTLAQLPQLINSGDWQALLKVANDANAEEALRMGAIEGLALMNETQIDTALLKLTKEGGDEDINKAAYRALRRRQRAKAKFSTGVSA